MLNTEQLMELEDQIKADLDDYLTPALTKLNRTGKLEELLLLLGMEHLLLNNENKYKPFKTGKILVIGQSDVKQNVILGVGERLGIEKNRFELYLDYEDAKTFKFQNIQYKPEYSLILVGPMPHSGISKGDYGSVISAIENEVGYPPVIRLGENGLKISKSNIRAELCNALEKGLIIAS